MEHYRSLQLTTQSTSFPEETGLRTHIQFLQNILSLPNQEVKEYTLYQASLNATEFSQGSQILIDAA